MAFCTKCGSSLDEETVFCSTCGFCLGGAAVSQPSVGLGGASAVQAAPDLNVIGEYCREAITSFLGMMYRPLTMIEVEAGRNDVQSGMILAIILAVLQGIGVIWMVKAAANALYSVYSTIFGEWMSLLGGQDLGMVDLPYGSIFVHALLFAILSMAVLFLAGLLLGRFAFKSKMTAASVFNATIVAWVPFVVAIFAAVLVSYLNIVIAMAVYFAGLVVFLICVFWALKTSTGIKHDHALLITPVALLAVMFVLSLVIRLIAG